MTFRMNEEFSFMHPVIHETIKVGPTEKYFKEGLKLVHSTKEAFALLIQRAWVCHSVFQKQKFISMLRFVDSVGWRKEDRGLIMLIKYI